MAYNEAERTTYSFPAVNFGANSTRYIKGPAGKLGKIKEIMVGVTTSFVGTTTPGAVNIGPSGSLTEHATLALGSAGAGPAAGAVVRASDTPKVSLPNTMPYAAEIYLEKDTVQSISFVAPTGGSPAGVADVFVTVDWSIPG